ncbi:MAG: hypothetical protein AAGK00_09090 [Pseudomonadota bacterium]
MSASERDHIPEKVMADLQQLDLQRGRPLLAVDADEVLVVFVDHLDRFMRTIGFEMRLVRYELEGSMFPIGSDEALPFQECIQMIDRFFRQETLNQTAVPDGPEVLARLSQDVQVVVLTNVPSHAGALRRQNLAALGIPYPVVVNSGGKGRTMRWLADQVDAPVAFIDDSVKQVESVAKHVPEAVRLHFAWADFIHRIFPECAHATRQVRSWTEADEALRHKLGLPA